MTGGQQLGIGLLEMEIGSRGIRLPYLPPSHSTPNWLGIWPHQTRVIKTTFFGLHRVDAEDLKSSKPFTVLQRTGGEGAGDGEAMWAGVYGGEADASGAKVTFSKALK